MCELGDRLTQVENKVSILKGQIAELKRRIERLESFHTESVPGSGHGPTSVGRRTAGGK